jgi:CRP-like cAMP-binding protein
MVARANRADTGLRQELPEIRARPFERESGSRPRIRNLLSHQQQLILNRSAQTVEYLNGNTKIFAEGENAHFVYSVGMGVVRLSRNSSEGRRQLLALMLPGDVFGLPDHSLHVNSADTICPSVLYRIPWPRLRELLKRESDLQFTLLNRLAYDLREAQRRIITLGQQNTYQRVASFLLDFIQSPAFFDSDSGILTMPLTRFDIGDYLGMAPETVARALKKFERENILVRQSPRLLKVVSVEALLRAQAGPKRSKFPSG